MHVKTLHILTHKRVQYHSLLFKNRSSEQRNSSDFLTFKKLYEVHLYIKEHKINCYIITLCFQIIYILCIIYLFLSYIINLPRDAPILKFWSYKTD